MTHENEQYEILHLYGQHSWHTSAAIVGNRKGLQQLRDGIDQALQGGQNKIDTMCNDGEGYDLFIVVDNDPTCDHYLCTPTDNNPIDGDSYMFRKVKE